MGQPVDLADGGRVTVAADGGFVFDPDGDFDALRFGESAETSFTYSVRDQNGAPGAAPATVTLTVEGVNDAPEARDDQMVAAPTGSTGTNVFRDNGFGADDDVDGDLLQVVEVDGQAALVGVGFALADGGRAQLRANGALLFNPNGEFDDLDPGETAETGLSYRISDGEGGFDIAEIFITVQAPLV